MRRLCFPALVAACSISLGLHAVGQTTSEPPTTAWQMGKFHFDTPGVVGRSDIVLARPNLLAKQALPLGNGRLGAAVWAAEGLTAQLNRVDTLPGRLSPGQVVIPGLAALTAAPDYSGRLDLYNGALVEHGAGMTATVYVQPDQDTLAIDVTGADPEQLQTAQLRLWNPRKPRAIATGQVGLLAETWTDDKDPGASGRAFGSLAAITAEGRNVSVDVTNPLAITLSVRPKTDGSFRILVAAPHYDGKDDPAALAHAAFPGAAPDAHRQIWNGFWQHAGLFKLTSPDGTAEYMENLRTLYLFSAAASSGEEIPGSQAGIADLFSSVRDVHHWDPAAFWHWNLRMLVAANLGAGLPELNASYFRLYRDNLPRIEEWTAKHMTGHPGICVPETMRFNGQGIEYESGPGWGPNTIGMNCDAASKPYYNARTLSTGAEVSLWVWQHYQQTLDRHFLADNYPVMAASARFLLAYQKPASDGLDHTSPSNAHETQWDIMDPITDISARMALFPAAIEAAKLLGKDAALVRQMQAALPRIPPIPRVRETGVPSLLPASYAGNDDVIAASYEPAATNHNVENLGLEPVWPFNLIGVTSPLLATSRRTYAHRPNQTDQDWSFDPIHAARLGLGSEVSKTLATLTTKYQTFPNGFANWGGEFGEFYIEQSGVVATALQEALVQDFDGVIRIAPAVPPGWDFEGSVFVRGKTKVDVQVRGGVPITVVIESGTRQQLKIRNPWPGHSINVVAADSGKKVPSDTKEDVASFSAVADSAYRIEPAGHAARRFAPVSGTPATEAKHLGPVQIGLSAHD